MLIDFALLCFSLKKNQCLKVCIQGFLAGESSTTELNKRYDELFYVKVHTDSLFWHNL